MNIIKWSIMRPVSVAVGVILVVLFGLIGLGAIPIQLTPTVDRPIITVTTEWPGRSPEEIIDQITRRQEERFKSVSNLKSMRSTSREGAAEVTLEFMIGASMSRALQEVSDALRQVPRYPEDVQEPRVKAAEGASENAIAWIILDLDPAAVARHPGFDITTLFDAVDREVKPYLERIDGVAEVNVYGGRPKEVHILLEAVALAQRGLTYQDVIDALRRENSNISAGSIAEGKRDYRVRVVGQFETTEDVLSTIVAYRDGRPVYVRDIGTAEIGFQKQRGFVRALGHPSLAMNVIRQSGANVVEVMDDVRARLDEVRAEILPRIHPAGADLRLRQVYDETVYIHSAIDLVIKNLGIGGALPAAALLLFLRSVKTTIIIAIAIPISIIATFLVMLAFGRTLNVISLAGLAFATGMVVDNAVVVLENIDRRRTLGDTPFTAVYRGTSEVWGAILAGTLTTVAVFLPLLTIQEEVGQLFFDLTLALSVSVLLSLIVATTVVPSAAGILLGSGSKVGSRWKFLRELFGLAPLGARATRALGSGIYWLISGWRGWTLRPAVILIMTSVSIYGAVKLMPPLDYLPAGNRNLVFGGLLIPPGLSLDQQTRYAERIESVVAPYMAASVKDPASVAALPPIPRFDAPGATFDPVPVDNFFIGGFNGGMFAGATSQVEDVVIPIGNLLTVAMNGLPDVFGGARQASIFGMGVGGGNSIDLEISGFDLARVNSAARMLFFSSAQRYTFGNVRPDPANFMLSQPETRLVLNRAGRELGLRTSDLGIAARSLVDGAYAGEFKLDSRTVDIVLLPRLPEGETPYREDLFSIPIATPAGRVVPLGSVVDIVPANAPQQIRRIEEWPSVTIRITPPQGRTLGEVMNEIQTDIIAPARAMGVIDPTMRIRLEGTAARLTEVKSALFGIAARDGDMPPWRRAIQVLSLLIAAAGLAVGAWAMIRALRGKRRDFAYGAVGFLIVGLVLAGLFMGIATQPQLITARFVWALLVTYLLMCALFESFIYPFVIMFSVPLAVVGGFAALRIVHDWTMANPTVPAQQFDVLTMIGFVMLIGVVVNNAILLVQQALNFMQPGHGFAESDEAPLSPLDAIAQSVRTRVRPIFMTTFTTIGGGLPLVLAPGAGSEMYRGLGAVVVGGLFVSTIFTLLLVPLVFSVVIQMRMGAIALLYGSAGPVPAAPLPAPHPHANGEYKDAAARQERQAGQREPVSH
jgi:hydrophobic/amphiphilic exporter-1 (mainly G- bacteria), HAE1 family